MAELVKCKACGKEIAKGVKKCPHCGKDQRNWFMRHKFLSFILLIIVIGVISAVAGGGNNQTTPTTKNGGTNNNAEKIYKLNEPVDTGNTEVNVTKVEEKATVGNQYLKKDASTGGTFVAIQYTLKNTSDKPVNPFSFPSVQLTDEKGTKYDADVDASGYYATETGVDNSKILSDLNPGIQVTNTKVFEISQDQFKQGKWYLLVDGKEKVQIK